MFDYVVFDYSSLFFQRKQFVALKLNVNTIKRFHLLVTLLQSNDAANDKDKEV